MADNTKAVEAFIARKVQIDAILARLAGLSADHFGVAPEQVTWGHVGDLAHYAEQLQAISDQAFQEGEFAEVAK
jgi:hypothetical protein